MKRDKLKLYILEFLLLGILFLALFVSKIFTRANLAVVLLIFAVVIKLIIKKKNIISIYKNQAIWLMVGFSLIYLLVFYIMGIYFGYYKSATPFGFNTMLKFVLPLTIIILSSEIIRKTFIIQKGKISKITTFISMVLIDLIIYSGVYDVTELEDMLMMLGFIFFASVACNLLYNYITIRFGSKGVIIYRLITILYIYFIPYIPDVYLFFRMFLRMIYPFIIYLVFEYTYSKTSYAIEYNKKGKNIFETGILLIIMIVVIGLISCQFKYGVLVIGTGSMTGTIDAGDVALYEAYEGGPIKIDTIIIFEKENSRIVHRVIDIENVNGEYRYYTKGDANQQIDEGYVQKKEIVGIVKLKIKYLGYPSLWLRDIFS